MSGGGEIIILASGALIGFLACSSPSSCCLWLMQFCLFAISAGSTISNSFCQDANNNMSYACNCKCSPVTVTVTVVPVVTVFAELSYSEPAPCLPALLPACVFPSSVSSAVAGSFCCLSLCMGVCIGVYWCVCAAYVCVFNAELSEVGSLPGFLIHTLPAYK